MDSTSCRDQRACRNAGRANNAIINLLHRHNMAAEDHLLSIIQYLDGSGKIYLQDRESQTHASLVGHESDQSTQDRAALCIIDQLGYTLHGSMPPFLTRCGIHQPRSVDPPRISI
jgi:hypothetical protein